MKVGFQAAAQSERFAITADLTLKGGSTADDVSRQAALLGPWVDGIQVTDNPWAWVQMSALAAASLLQREGIDPIPVLSCRDRNRIALQSDLLALRALGVSSVLLTRGQKIPADHPVKATTVFDVSGRELVALAASLGSTEAGPPGEAFFIGTGARAFRPAAGWDAESLNERSRAGARFLQTQLCFNLGILRQYMKCLVETRMTWKYSVMISLTPLPSAVTATWLKKNLGDSRIPKEVIKRLEQAPDAEQEGIAICAELMQEISAIPGVSGVNLMTTGDPGLLCEAIKASGLR
ncbi:MAG TPA: methylenetetrahydrofolate reductase [Xanthomonadales bacterium]|nr:methylenetetrahydrofolate reductase [Xanthomonadales bacterium]